MKKWILTLVLVLLCGAGPLAAKLQVQAKARPDDTILPGVYAEEISLQGMTRAQAAAEIQQYVETLKQNVIALQVSEGNMVSVTAGDLGLFWNNPGIVEEAVNLGQTGNVVVRYKALKDLENQKKIFDIQYGFDQKAISAVVDEKCCSYDQEAVDAHLQLVDGVFEIVDGQSGVLVDCAASKSRVYEVLTTEWNGGDAVVDLVVKEEAPKGRKEDLEQVKDVLGSYTTSFSSSNRDRSANVTNGCSLINGMTLYPGESFSMYETVSPFTEENGYYMAGSYLNGMVVDSLGGGICQVSTTLYNAVLKAELQIDERHNHSMIVSYVKPSMDAAIAESSGKDFIFTNNKDFPIYIEGYTKDRKITFNIYGAEKRDPGRTVTFESEIIETIHPENENIIQTDKQPIGWIDIQSVHIGYKAKLWKVVKENGVEVSREQINSSNYKMVPRTATVGVATEDSNAYNTLQAAIATGNINHVREVASALKSGSAVTAPDPALSELLVGKSAQEQETIIQQYKEQLAQQQGQ